MKTKTIVITGGPGSGKTSVINALAKKGYTCFEEISRQVILDARKEGVEQLFLTDPLNFSERVLKQRITQYNTAIKSDKAIVFLDRGILDVQAYMDFKGDNYPKFFREACKNHKYDAVFILPPWDTIFTTDNERYESFEEATQIHHALVKTYTTYNYNLNEVPFGTIEARANHIINAIKTL